MRNPFARTFALALLLSVSGVTFAQQTPFDMSPENSLREPPAAPAPLPATPPAATPAPMPIAPAPLQIAPQSPAAVPVAPVAPVAPTPVAPAPTATSRFFIPATDLRHEGEADRSAFQIYLTGAQAEAPATLELGYLNAIVAAPEASRLDVRINGTSVLSNPIASPQSSQIIRATIPAGLLRAGANRVDISTVSRHRTDCSIASTYELWTQIDPASAVIRFEGANLDRLTRLDEIAAIGFDSTGLTTVRLYAPGIARPDVSAAAMELVQEIALALRVPSVKIELLDAPPTTTGPGILNIVFGTARELPPMAAAFSQQSAVGPVAAFLPAGSVANTLVVSGPDLTNIKTALRAIYTPATPPTSGPTLAPRADRPFPVPILTGASSISLSELGVETVEFNGRRYKTSFAFALPADFFGNMYGQAQLILDAAYTREVLPGSQIDLYVNGQIASATPVLRTDGGFLRDTPISIPMTNLRPGRNLVDIEIQLHTQSDEVCAPGTSQSTPSRFLLSASSQLRLPNFARIGQVPDLAAFVGTGAPYAGGEPVKVLLGRGEQVIPAALTWLARIGISAGTVVPVEPVVAMTPDPASKMLIVGALSTLPDDVVSRSGVARTVSSGEDGQPISLQNDDATLDRWRDNIALQGADPFTAMRDRIAQMLNLKPDNFWLLRPRDGAYLPQSADAIIVAQAQQREGGTWTYLTVPDDANMVTGVQRLVEPANWRAVAGRVSALGPDDKAVLTVPASEITLVPTQPWSFENIRLIAANWLSTYILTYTVLLVIIAFLLTIATIGLLRIVGRQG